MNRKTLAEILAAAKAEVEAWPEWKKLLLKGKLYKETKGKK